MIKSDSVPEIIKTAISKLNLPEDGDYKVNYVNHCIYFDFM